MSLKVKIHKEFEIKKCRMKCDKRGDIKDPLPLYHSFLIISGGPSSGKTNLWMNMIFNKHIYRGKFHFVDVFSPSLKTIDKKIEITNGGLYPDFSLELLNEVIERQKQMNDVEDEEDKECLLILDDVVAKMKKNMDELISLAFNRRHLHVTLLIITQKYNKVPKELRCVASHLALFKAAKSDMKDVFEEWSNLSRPAFDHICDEVYDKPHEFLFIRQDQPEKRKYGKGFNLIENVEEIAEYYK